MFDIQKASHASTVKEFIAWLSAAPLDQFCEYYCGNLALEIEHNKRLLALKRLAWEQMEEGNVHLFQHRGDDGMTYLAQRTINLSRTI